ncbi:unnamed protein product [Adineta steineri]|uniref:Uncharacterized protein n=1 Tax=Adineta steineri TaxID=433720 RepID=A0A815H4A8_9BILA|nr:unnamed protein product [Adineta steineri]
MTRYEEKLYFQSVFDAIDQVYNLKKSQKHSGYEERLRASFNKLLIPDWYNHEYTATNGLRKTKSHGHVPRVKRSNTNNDTNNNTNNNNNSISNHHNNNDDTPDTSVSSSINSPHLSNGNHKQSYRHRSTSRSWSERPPLRRDSTTSTYDTNASVINGRSSTTSNGSTSLYAPGVQRVAQSSTWYKPRSFSTKISNGNTNGHLIEVPKPLPRCSQIENSINIQPNDHHEISSNDCVEGLTLSMTRIIEGDTYPISDNESATDSVYIADTNNVILQQNNNDEQGELNRK